LASIFTSITFPTSFGFGLLGFTTTAEVVDVWFHFELVGEQNNLVISHR
jgi:hypothetical protein